MDPGTWRQGSDTCRCWSPQTGRYWSHRSSTQVDLKVKEKAAILHCRIVVDEVLEWGFKRLLTFDALGLKIQRPGFAAEPLSGSINPNVHGLDFIPLSELHVLLLDSFTQCGAGGHGHLISYYNTPEDKKKRREEEKLWDLGALWITCCVTGVWGAQKIPKQHHCLLFQKGERVKNALRM